jgi:hypothetical protein
MAEDQNGNGSTQGQSRTTILEVAMATVREQVKSIRSDLLSHLQDKRREDEERELGIWRDAVDQELEEIRDRHIAEDERAKIEKSIFEREWRAIVFTIGILFQILALLHSYKVF